MSVQHAWVGDPFVGQSQSTNAKWCSCACARCMSGSCCMFPPENVSVGTTTTTNTTAPSGWECGALDHYFAVLDPARLFCRKCGATRKV